MSDRIKREELIKRIDEATEYTSNCLTLTPQVVENILFDCRAALSRKYVPMTDDELLEAWDKTKDNEWLHESLGIFEAEVIRRAGLEVSND